MAMKSDLFNQLCHLENSELELLIALAKVRSERLRLLRKENINLPLESSPLAFDHSALNASAHAAGSKKPRLEEAGLLLTEGTG